ncbi:tetratricopeptide repeat protein [Vibrio algivorus]|nr:tetratricopeptide repeat protein [Vibrio algivorus]
MMVKLMMLSMDKLFHNLLLSLLNKKAILVCLLISLFAVSFNSSAAGVTPYTGKKLTQASELAQNDHLDKAIKVLTSYDPKADYDKAFVNRVLAIYYWQAEQPKSSITALKKAVGLNVLEPKVQWQANRMLGDILYSGQDFANAAKEYRNTLAVKYTPSGADKTQFKKDTNEVYFRLAAAYYQQQQWAQVRSSVIRYQALDAKKRLQALRMQVIAEFRLKQWGNAEGTLTHLIRLEPNNKAWWQQQISTQLQQHKNQSALETYSLAKKHNLEFTANDYKSLSQLYAQNKIPERGARILEEMFQAYPESKTVTNQKTQAYYYQMAREWPQAIASWEALAKRDAQYYWPLTQLYIQQKDYNKANQVIDKAQPYAKKSEFGLAKIQLLYRLEKYNDALAEAKRLNEVQPSASAQTWIVFLNNKLQSQPQDELQGMSS